MAHILYISTAHFEQVDFILFFKHFMEGTRTYEHKKKKLFFVFMGISKHLIPTTTTRLNKDNNYIMKRAVEEVSSHFIHRIHMTTRRRAHTHYYARHAIWIYYVHLKMLILLTPAFNILYLSFLLGDDAVVLLIPGNSVCLHHREMRSRDNEETRARDDTALALVVCVV